MPNRPSLDISTSVSSPESDELTPLASKKPPRPGRQLWKAWLWLTGPRPERFSDDIAGKERLRRSRLVSVLLVLAALVMLLLIPSALRDMGLWQAILILAALGLLAALLNRRGQVTLSGLAVIALADFSVIENILRQPYGLTNTTLADLYLLVIAIMIAGMVLPNIFIPITGAAQVLISLAIFSLLHHDILLTREIQKVDGNMGYTSVLGPILLQVCGAGIVWLYSWSVDRAILRASRAEELATARARINEQARQIAGQKQRLEHGIQTLQDTQSRIIRGDYSARASLQDQELLPLAVSFNMVAERLSHVHQIEEEHQRLQSALQRLLEACNAMARGAAPAVSSATGTLADRIFPHLQRLHTLATQALQSGTFVDDLRSVLQRQQEHLAQMERELTSSIKLAKNTKEKTSAVLARPVDDLASSSLSARAADLQNTLMDLSILLTQQITLLEQTGKNGAQAHQLGTHCIHGARILSQRLKEAG